MESTIEERMCDFLKGKDLELQDIIHKGPKVPIAKYDKEIVTGTKIMEQYNGKDVKAIQENAKVKKILICNIGPGDYNQIS